MTRFKFRFLYPLVLLVLDGIKELCSLGSGGTAQEDGENDSRDEGDQRGSGVVYHLVILLTR